jgi:hypothetical protein
VLNQVGLGLSGLANGSAQNQGGWSIEAITGVVSAISATVLAIFIPLVRCWWRKRQRPAGVQNNVAATPSEREDQADGMSNFGCLSVNGVQAVRKSFIRDTVQPVTGRQ